MWLSCSPSQTPHCWTLVLALLPPIRTLYDDPDHPLRALLHRHPAWACLLRWLSHDVDNLQLPVCCSQTCRLQTSWTQNTDGIDPWLPHHQPVRTMSTPQLPFLTLSLKTFLWKPSGSSGLWALAAWTPHLKSCNKCCTFLHCNLVSVNWIYCMWASGPKFGSVTKLDCFVFKSCNTLLRKKEFQISLRDSIINTSSYIIYTFGAVLIQIQSIYQTHWGCLRSNSRVLKGCCWITKDVGILGLQRRNQSGARDEAWLLRAFV